MVVQYPGSHNVFIPDHESSGKLTVEFSRNEKDFAVNAYCQIVPVKVPAGFYRQVTIEEAGRIVNDNLATFIWADGQDRPEGFDGTESFEWKAFRCERFAFSATLGEQAIENAAWNISEEHHRIKAQQAMTGRTAKALAQLTNTSNYDSTHYASVSAIDGNTGTWSASTTARGDIKRSLNYAAEIIMLDTLSAVDVDDLVLVMSPATARSISQSQELIDHIKGSPDALAQIRGELPGRNAIFGLPDKLYGFPVVIEKTAKVTSRKAATRARSFALASGTPFMASRPGGLVGVADAPTFSTCVLFMREEMTVETLPDKKNRRTLISIVENYDAKVVAPVSGFLFQNAIS